MVVTLPLPQAKWIRSGRRTKKHVTMNAKPCLEGYSTLLSRLAHIHLNDSGTSETKDELSSFLTLSKASKQKIDKPPNY